MSSTLKSAIIAFLAAVTIALGIFTAAIKNEPVVTQPSAGVGGTLPIPLPIGGKGGSGPVVVVPVDAGTPVVVPPAPAAKAGFSVGIQNWFTDAAWSGEKVFSSQGVLNPTYVAQIAKFSTFRTLDIAAINCSKETNWSGRRLPSNTTQVGYGAADGDGSPGVAWEYIVDIANAANTGLWVQIPALATDDYVLQLSKLVAGRLKSNLPLYLEYSNETWNGSFCQFSYVNTQGTAAGLGNGNQYYAGSAFTLKKVLAHGAIFKQVLPRTQTVFAFSGNYDLAAQALKNSAQKPDMLAVAPYIDTGNGATTTLAAFKAVVDKLGGAGTDTIGHARSIADANGIKVLGCYEAGTHFTTAADQAAKNAAVMGDGVKYMLDKWSTVLNGPCNLYTHASIQNAGGAWGLYDASGAITLKGSAVLSWIDAHK